MPRIILQDYDVLGHDPLDEIAENWTDNIHDGERFAEALLKLLDWTNVHVFLRTLSGASVLHAFFRGFLAHVTQRAPDRLEEAARIDWQAKTFSEDAKMHRMLQRAKIPMLDAGAWSEYVYDGRTGEYYRNVEALIEHYINDSLPVPDICYGTRPMPMPRIDAGWILEHALEECHEDAAQNVDEKGLQKLLDDWCDTQDPGSCDVDYDVVISLEGEEEAWRASEREWEVEREGRKNSPFDDEKPFG